MKHKSAKDTAIIGFALFSMFFGAGNRLISVFSPDQSGLKAFSVIIWPT